MNGAAEGCPEVLGSVDIQDAQALSTSSPEHSQKKNEAQIGLEKGFLMKVRQDMELFHLASKLRTNVAK